jgi:regulatory protein
VNARAARFGQRRIQLELAQHGLALDSETAAELKSTEIQRARDLWQRRFGELPVDVAARAKQARFLAGRGFSGDTIRKVLKGGDGD